MEENVTESIPSPVGSSSVTDYPSRRNLHYNAGKGFDNLLLHTVKSDLPNRSLLFRILDLDATGLQTRVKKYLLPLARVFNFDPKIVPPTISVRELFQLIVRKPLHYDLFALVLYPTKARASDGFEQLTDKIYRAELNHQVSEGSLSQFVTLEDLKASYQAPEYFENSHCGLLGDFLLTVLSVLALLHNALFLDRVRLLPRKESLRPQLTEYVSRCFKVLLDIDYPRQDYSTAARPPVSFFEKRFALYTPMMQTFIDMVPLKDIREFAQTSLFQYNFFSSAEGPQPDIRSLARTIRRIQPTLVRPGNSHVDVIEEVEKTLDLVADIQILE